jgi:CRP/FNR family cyclic AMP-dependent transcriptional regulator
MEKHSIDPEWDNVFRYVEQEETSVLDVLVHVPIFSLLTSRELQRIAQAMHLRTYAKGECVIRSGASQSGFYVIFRGSVDVVGRTGSVVGTLHSPELIGEFALLDDSPRSSSLVAAEPSELIGFFKPDLMDILVTNPELGCKILLRMSEEMACNLQRDYAKLCSAGFPFNPSDNGMAMDPMAQ